VTNEHIKTELDTIDILVKRCEEARTIDHVDRCERLLRSTRPAVQGTDLKPVWSELCRRVAVVRDSLIKSPPLLTGATNG
jgi:hypothetical protein